MVERYGPGLMSDAGLRNERNKTGVFALYSDYAALKAENERLKKALSEQIDRDISGIFPGERALAERAGGVRFVGNIPGSSSASGFAPLTTEPAAPEERQEAVAWVIELSRNTGELKDKMAEAIRGDTTSDDTPWATLSEDRKIGWRGDAERALAVVKEYLTARRPSEQAVTEAMVDVAARAIANAWGETWECCCTAKRGLDCDCGDAMVEERDGYDERLSRDDCRMAARTALKAAMEAGG